MTWTSATGSPSRRTCAIPGITSRWRWGRRCNSRSPPKARWPSPMQLPRSPLSLAGFVAIWAFLLLFVFYPLTRIFYDAFTDEAGRWTFANFYEFFTDPYYLRSLWKSLALGAAAVFTTS